MGKLILTKVLHKRRQIFLKNSLDLVALANVFFLYLKGYCQFQLKNAVPHNTPISACPRPNQSTISKLCSLLQAASIDL